MTLVPKVGYFLCKPKLASYTGRKHCISCANGTDAIGIALMAAGIGAGDAFFVPDFTFFSSGECPATVGAVLGESSTLSTGDTYKSISENAMRGSRKFDWEKVAREYAGGYEEFCKRKARI